VRLARVLYDGSPIVALERDGALYDVTSLEERFGATHCAEGLRRADDFHARVVSLGCAGLADLDAALLAGRRPTEARLATAPIFLPPCDTDRALVVMSELSSTALEEPALRIAPARSSQGSGALLSFSNVETRFDLTVGVAVLLGEDLHRATADEAARSFVGLCIGAVWTCHETARTALQLGPVLVTPPDASWTDVLRAQTRIDGVAEPPRPLEEARFSLAEIAAFASQTQELRAGDLVLSLRARAATGLAVGARVEVSVERLGKLVGSPCEGPAPVVWRRA
jgi:hypothetical protein